MKDLPEGFEFGEGGGAGGGYCFRVGAGSPAMFQYIPSGPTVETPPALGGQAAANLTDSPGAATVAIQTVWKLSPEGYAALKDALAARYPDAPSPLVGMAALSSVTGRLLVGEGGPVIGPKDSSGSEPWRIVLQETVPQGGKAALLGAFGGQTGVLTLVYSGTLVLDETVRARIFGDLAPAIRALAPEPDGGGGDGGGGLFSWGRRKPPHEDRPKKPQPTLALCRDEIARQIAAGALKQTVERSPNAPQALVSNVTDALTERIAQQLLGALPDVGGSAGSITGFNIDQSNSGSESVSYAIERRTDLGAWFARNNGGALIHRTSITISAP